MLGFVALLELLVSPRWVGKVGRGRSADLGGSIPLDIAAFASWAQGPSSAPLSRALLEEAGS